MASILKSATIVVTTVHMLDMIFVSTELITDATPDMSEFILVMMSPCFSEVKKECGIACRWLNISFFISRTILLETQLLIYDSMTPTMLDIARVKIASTTSFMSSARSFPSSASSMILAVISEGSSPSTEDRMMMANTMSSWNQYGLRYLSILTTSCLLILGAFCFSSSVRNPLGPKPWGIRIHRPFLYVPEKKEQEPFGTAPALITC